MSFKSTAYDRWLTTDPHEQADNWVDNVCEHFTSQFYETNEKWINGEQSNLWFIRLIDKSPEEAARIIERGFKLYKLTTNPQ